MPHLGKWAYQARRRMRITLGVIQQGWYLCVEPDLDCLIRAKRTLQWRRGSCPACNRYVREMGRAMDSNRFITFLSHSGVHVAAVYRSLQQQGKIMDVIYAAPRRRSAGTDAVASRTSFRPLLATTDTLLLASVGNAHSPQIDCPFPGGSESNISPAGSCDAHGTLMQSGDRSGIRHQLGCDALNRLIQSINHDGSKNQSGSIAGSG